MVAITAQPLTRKGHMGPERNAAGSIFRVDGAVVPALTGTLAPSTRIGSLRFASGSAQRDGCGLRRLVVRRWTSGIGLRARNAGRLLSWPATPHGQQLLMASNSSWPATRCERPGGVRGSARGVRISAAVSLDRE